MQETHSKQAEAIGSAETDSVARELPAKLRIDGEEYTITHDSRPAISNSHFEMVEAVIPCIRCDTKNQLQYSGSIPSLVSCTCSHCGHTLTVAADSERTRMSASLLGKYLQKYQKRRLAYIEGQNVGSEPTYIRWIVSGVLVLPTLLSLGLFVHFVTTSWVVRASGTILPTSDVAALGTLGSISAVPFLVLFAIEAYPIVLSWILGISSSDKDGISEFLAGCSDSD